LAIAAKDRLEYNAKALMPARVMNRDADGDHQFRTG